jgi:hypothetical protein
MLLRLTKPGLLALAVSAIALSGLAHSLGDANVKADKADGGTLREESEDEAASEAAPEDAAAPAETETDEPSDDESSEAADETEGGDED